MKIRDILIMLGMFVVITVTVKTADYFYVIKPLHKTIERAIDRATITNNYDKIKALKGASIGVTNNSSIERDSIKDNKKWRFWKRK